MLYKKYNNKKGFTLVELIIVIAILAVLTTVATISIVSIGNRSRITTVETELTKYKSAYDAWIADTGGAGSKQDFLDYIDPDVQGSNYKISSGITPDIQWDEKAVYITVKNITGKINLNTGDITCPT